ncbi:MAG TPA: hypothetical protein VGN26_12025 [Armatimonadota bacterium]|jgi:hypothetical protein
MERIRQWLYWRAHKEELLIKDPEEFSTAPCKVWAFRCHRCSCFLFLDGMQGQRDVTRGLARARWESVRIIGCPPIWHCPSCVEAYLEDEDGYRTKHCGIFYPLDMNEDEEASPNER